MTMTNSDTSTDTNATTTVRELNVETSPEEARETIQQLRDEDVCVHFDRDGYDAFVRAATVGRWDGFDIRHKHDHESRWRCGSLDESGLKAELQRLPFRVEPMENWPTGPLEECIES